MVGGRPYEIACNAGDEANVLSLANSLNDRVAKISKSLGGIGNETLALVVTGLMMEDEIRTLQSSSTNRNQQQINEKEISERVSRSINEVLSPITEKLEALANSLEV